MDDPRWIEYLPVDELPDNPRNAKSHATDLIGASAGRFGFIEPVVLDDRTGTLVSGHGRKEFLIEARDTGKDAPEGIVVRDGVWLSPVVRGWSSTDDLEADAATVALNRPGEVGGWDMEKLADILGDLAQMEDGLEGLGYDDDALAEIIGRDDDGGGFGGEEEVPEPPVDPVTKPGDVWLLGVHRVLCGDCRNPDDMAVLVSGASVNLAFTSPPYADRRKYDETSGFKPIPPDEYVEWFEAVAARVAEVLADDGSWFVNIRAGCEDGERLTYDRDLVPSHRGGGWLFVDDLCWVDSANGVPGGWNNRFKDAWEPVFHFARQRSIKFRPLANGHASDGVFAYAPDLERSNTGSGLLGEKGPAVEDGMARPSNVITLASSHFSDHSAAFPVGLPQWFIRAYSDEGDTVLDPFMGSGSTLLAADREKRIGYGMELSPGYCDVICRRFQAETGIIPILEATGEPHDFCEE